MSLKFRKISFEGATGTDDQDYTFHKVSGKLVEYGYYCFRNSGAFYHLRIQDIFERADVIAHRFPDTFKKGAPEILNIKLKFVFTLKREYKGKNLFIAYVDKKLDRVIMYEHDKALKLLPKKILEGWDWQKRGIYSTRYPDSIFDEIRKGL